MHDQDFPDRGNKNFGERLEQYVFLVGDLFIEQADSQTQHRLVRLFVEAGKESDPEPVNEVDRHDET